MKINNLIIKNKFKKKKIKMMVTYMPKIDGKITMTSQVILEEASDQEKQKEEFYISAIMLFGVVANGLLVVFQTGSSFRFYKLTRHLGEVGWMPHFINILTIISGICLY